jgi:polyisoprenoid-binding protein YceI
MQTTSQRAAATPRLGRYEIDTNGSGVTFRTRHLFGLAPVHGTFAIRSGTVDVAAPVTASRVHAEIDTASFLTGNGQRDATVRSERFLDTASYPVMTFVAEPTGERELAGTLTVNGVARPVSLTIEEWAAAPGAFTARATTRIDRTEFGVTAARGLAGRYLDLTLAIRCVLVLRSGHPLS